MTKAALKTFPMRMTAVLVAFVLACTTVLPSYALAASSDSLQAELEEVQAELQSLYAEAEQTAYELYQAQADLEEIQESIAQVEEEIEQTEIELAEAQDNLAEIISSNYKDGPASLLSVVLNATSIEDLISRLYYANKISSAQQDAVEEVQELQAQLTAQQSELEQQEAEQLELVEELTVRQDAADAAAAEAQAYYDELDAELQEAIAAEEAAASAAALETAAAYQETISNASSSSSSSSSAVTADVATMVARAYSVIGSAYRYTGYVWTGDVSTSAFTCSGLIDYALGLPSNSSWPESLFAKVKAAGNMKYSVSELNYGDLVFFYYAGRSPGHVGIYIGDGLMIDSCPGTGVQIRSAATSTFIGGGSYF